MLVGANDGGVDEQLFKVSIPLECLGDAMPYPLYLPAGETNTYEMPVAQFLRQIAPRAVGTRHIQHGFDKPLVVCGSPTLIRRFPR